MVTHAPVIPFAVRAFRSGLLAGSLLTLMLGTSGCGHRRVAMRPVYATPIQTTAPVVVAPEPACATPGCAPAPTMTTSPASAEPFLNSTSTAPTFGSPTTSGVVRAGGGSPPAPDVSSDPVLNLDEPQGLGPITPSTSGTINPTGAVAPIRPRSFRGTARPTSLTSQPRAALIEQVRPFLSNPEDLVHPPKADRPWRYVVLHGSATPGGGLDAIDHEHRKVLGFDGCGYHFIIGNGTDTPDGQIEVADRWLNQKNGVHCRNGRNSEVNEYGVAICLVGNFEKTEPTARQVAAARALVAYLGDRYAIPTERRGTHDQFADGPTHCPGRNFPTDAILGSTNIAQR